MFGEYYPCVTRENIVADQYCPQCDVAMEETAVTAEGVGDLYVKTKREKGVLKRLGIGESTSLDAFLCPECGLTQLYADLST